MSKIGRAATLMSLLGLLGCHQEVPEAVELARQKLAHEKQLTTDRASLLFAQQELALAETKRASGTVDSKTAEQSASYHVSQAELRLKLDLDEQQFDQDLKNWKAFIKMLKQVHAHEGQS